MRNAEETQARKSTHRAGVFMGNVKEFVEQFDWTAAEKAAREAIGELQALVTTLTTASDRKNGGA